MVLHAPTRKTSSTALELRGSLRYYSPEAVKERGIRWPDPPHVYFANLQLDWKSLLKFDKTFGPLLREHRRLTPEMQAILDKAPNQTDAERERWATSEQKFEIAIYEPGDVQIACGMQRLLRAAWRGEQLAVQIIEFGTESHAHREAYGPPLLKAAPTPKGIDVYADDLWNYIRVAFLYDHSAGRARVCTNPECGAPYFLAKRKDKRVCGQEECTAWAQRKWALDWWNATGHKRRQQRSGKSPKSQQRKTGTLR